MLMLTPTSDIAKDFFAAIGVLPKATLEQIYFAIGSELQDREVTYIESITNEEEETV